MAHLGYALNYEDSSSNGHVVGGWSPSPDGPPETFKALQGLSLVLRQHDDEKKRLSRENERLRIENQRVSGSNANLEHSIRRLQADLERRGGRAPAPADQAGRAPAPADQAAQSRFTEFRVLENHSEPVHTVAVKRNDLIATGSWDKTLQLYSLASDKVVHTFGGTSNRQAEMGGLYSVAFAKTEEDMLACTSADHKVYIWNYNLGTRVHVLSGHNDEVNSVTFHEKQHVICTASDDKKAMVWDFKEGTPLRTLDKHNAPVYGTSFLGEALQYNVATCCLASPETGKASFYVFDMRDKKEIVQRSDHFDDIIGIDFCSQQNLLATGSDDGFIRLYDLRTWSSVFVINTNESQASESANEVKRISFSPDGTMLAAGGSNRSVLIYSKKDDKWALTEELKGHEDCVFDVSWSKEGKYLASASHDKKCRIWQRTF